MSDWIVLNEYPFSLLPGDPVAVEGEALSYYQYLNQRSQETGKNVQCVAWLLRDRFQGSSIEEPFGGCGVFSTALQHRLKPRFHRIFELDAGCVAQLEHQMHDVMCLGKDEVFITQGDAHELAGREAADVYVCDFPYFTHTRYTEGGEWAPELARMASHRPRAILITDGSACRFHFVATALQRRGLNVLDKADYVKLMSERLYADIGYSITGCAHHGTCFYFRAEPTAPRKPEMLFLPAGSGPAGLRRVSA